MITDRAFGRPDGSHLSSETLDLLSLSALQETESARARAHVEKCEDCRGRLTELEADKQRFTQYVFPRTLPKLEERLRPQSWVDALRAKWKFALPLAGLVATAALLVVVAPVAEVQLQEPYYGTKGGEARLDVVALHGERQVAVGNDTVLAAGDRIRFLVEPGEARFLLVASRDGQGNVTVYFPYEGEVSASLQQAGFQELPGSIELDQVEGREKLFAVFSDAPVRAEDVRTSIEAGEDLRTLPGVREVVAREFVKEAK